MTCKIVPTTVEIVTYQIYEVQAPAEQRLNLAVCLSVHRETFSGLSVCLSIVRPLVSYQCIV